MHPCWSHPPHLANLPQSRAAPQRDLPVLADQLQHGGSGGGGESGTRMLHLGSGLACAAAGRTVAHGAAPPSRLQHRPLPATLPSSPPHCTLAPPPACPASPPSPAHRQLERGPDVALLGCGGPGVGVHALQARQVVDHHAEIPFVVVASCDARGDGLRGWGGSGQLCEPSPPAACSAGPVRACNPAEQASWCMGLPMSRPRQPAPQPTWAMVCRLSKAALASAPLLATACCTASPCIST